MFKTIVKRLTGKMSILCRAQVPTKTSRVECDGTSSLQRGKNVTLKDSTIVLRNGSRVVLEDGVTIEQFDLFLDKGSLWLGKSSILMKASWRKPAMVINDGQVAIANNCIVRADILCNYGGELKIGQYTDIAYDTSIRCSESITIGEFNMISYGCLILDNNTHEYMSCERRRERTIKDFPIIGAEYSKSSSRRIVIGNDVWIGQRATILKGSIVEDESVLGTAAVLAGKKIPFRSLGVGNPARVVARRD